MNPAKLWRPETPREHERDQRRFLKEVSERFSPETQAAIRRSICQARCACEMCRAAGGMDPDKCKCAGCADLKWLRENFPNSYAPRVCAECIAWVAERDAAEGAPTPWPILACDAFAFSEAAQESKFRWSYHYDVTNDVYVHADDD